MTQATPGRLLWLVTTRWRASVDRALAPLGLTHAQFVLLGSLHGLRAMNTSPSQRELADFAGLEPIYVSKLTRTLEQNGLLTRTGHPTDSRARQLTLTDRGTEVAQQAVKIVHRLQDELTAPIGGASSARTQELVHTLKALLAPEERTEHMPQPLLTGQDIGEAQGAVRALLDKTLEKTGVTSNEYIVLRVLALRGPWQPAPLHAYLADQAQLNLTPTAVTTLLTTLESRGLATNTTPNSQGPTQLTEEGTALHTHLTKQVQETTQHLYANLNPTDLATTHQVLTEVTKRANTLRNEP